MYVNLLLLKANVCKFTTSKSQCTLSTGLHQFRTPITTKGKEREHEKKEIPHRIQDTK